MNRLYPLADDFEARIRLYRAEEGGRRQPAVNGIRWDFAYADDTALTLYMIWPDFCDALGDSLPRDQPLPVGVELRAWMTVVNDEMRCTLHRQRLAPGTRFYCHEGPHRVAEGRITRLTGLFDPRSERAGH
ncbi:MAG: hypothetical protein GAK43_00810 [Stenotrophomonas maltophilia]|nr:MAG: hypothetical protein GAK43_00810 [Stenotrophomonas maltophilia]